MSATETPTDATATGTVLLVVSERTTAERYAEWLAPRYPTGLATDWRAALDVCSRDVAITVLSRERRSTAPLEFVDRAREEGYGGKIVLVTDPQPKPDATEVEFDSVLSKPVSKGTLIGNVDKLMLQVRYETRLERRLSITKRRAQLEETVADEALETDERYASLVSELNRLDTELDEIRSRFEPDDFPELFRGVLS